MHALVSDATFTYLYFLLLKAIIISLFSDKFLVYFISFLHYLQLIEFYENVQVSFYFYALLSST